MTRSWRRGDKPPLLQHSLIPQFSETDGFPLYAKIFHTKLPLADLTLQKCSDFFERTEKLMITGPNNDKRQLDPLPSIFYRELQHRYKEGYTTHWLHVLLRLPPILSVIPWSGCYATPKSTCLVSKGVGLVLRATISRDLQEEITPLPVYNLIDAAKDAMKFLKTYCDNTPVELNPFIQSTCDLFIYNDKKYGQQKNPDPHIKKLLWSTLKDRYLSEVIAPVVELFTKCLQVTHLSVVRNRRVYLSLDEYIEFDFVVMDKKADCDILPVVCLDLLHYHKPSTPMTQLDPTMGGSTNAQKFEAVKRYLLLGRAKSVLVTDFECSLVMQFDQAWAYEWEFTKQPLGKVPLSMLVFDVPEGPVPLKLGVLLLIEMEYLTDEGERHLLCVGWKRRKAIYEQRLDLEKRYRANLYLPPVACVADLSFLFPQENLQGTDNSSNGAQRSKSMVGPKSKGRRK